MSRQLGRRSPEDGFGRVPSSAVAVPTGGSFPFGSSRSSLNGAVAIDIEAFYNRQPPGMNRWKGDGRKQVSPNVESDGMGAKADSTDSSFGSTLPRKPKTEFKPRSGQVIQKSPFKNEKIALSIYKQPFCVNEDGVSVNVEQQLHNVRKTILEQEDIFREQVRELHRVVRIQGVLLAELKKKGSDIRSHSLGVNLGGPSPSSTDFPSINSGSKKISWSSGVGPALDSGGQDYEASIALPDPMKGGSTFPTIVPSETDVNVSHEVKLFKRSDCVPRVRRTFDLERPPEDDDDDDNGPDMKQEQVVKPPVQGDCMKFMETHPLGNGEPESGICLNLSAGWSGGISVKSGREYPSKEGQEISKASKCTRETEEAGGLFPFLPVKSDRGLAVQPAVAVTGQSRSEGLWELQLGRKHDSSPKEDDGSTPEEMEVLKKERHSFNLEVNERAVPVSHPAATPHWLLQVPVARTVKKIPGHTESLSLGVQDCFSPPQSSNEQRLMKPFPSHSGGETGPGLVSAQGSVWPGDRPMPGTPQDPVQPSHTTRTVEDVRVGIGGVYRTPILGVGSTGSVGAGYGPFKLSQGVGDPPHEALNLFSSWKEGEAPTSNFAHGVFTPNHSLTTGFGVQLRSFDELPGLATQGVVQVRPVHIGSGPAAFVADSSAALWYPRNPINQYQQYQKQQIVSHQATSTMPTASQGQWQAPVHLSQAAAYGQGTVYAIPAAASAPVGFPMDALRKVSEDISGASWPPGSAGPPFSPFSIVVPPKPQFRKPPKLVLTHDTATMELKLVPPEKGGPANILPVDKSFSGSSDDEMGDKGEKESALQQGRVQKEPDVPIRPRGKREREDRASTVVHLKEKSSPSGGGFGGWMTDKVCSSAAQGRVQAGRNGVQIGTCAGTATALSLVHREVMDEADGGSSNAGSGIGDVTKAGDHASPSLGSLAVVGSNRNCQDREADAGAGVEELGVQPDSESQSKKIDRKCLEEKPHNHQDTLRGQYAASFSLRGNIPMMTRKVPRENSDGPVEGSDHPQKRLRIQRDQTEELELGAQEELRASVFQRLVEQSASSSGSIKNLIDKGNHCHGASPAKPSSDELRNAQVTLQQPTSLTSVPRSHSLMMPDSGNQGKERLKLEEGKERSLSDQGDKLGGRTVMHTEGTGGGKPEETQRRTGFSDFGDIYKQREMKQGHSKQLSGTSASDKDVQLSPRSPGLHQAPSPSSREDMERQAEGSSKKVSQASETVQGNGRSPLGTGEWVEPTTLEQTDFCSQGGIEYSCKEVDGTLVKRLQGNGTEQKGKDVSPGGTHSASLSHKDLGRPDAAMDVTDPSSFGMCISMSTTEASQCATGDNIPESGVLGAERQSANSRRMTGLSPVVDEGKSHTACLEHSNQPKAQITGKPEGSMDGDKDSVSSSKPTQDLDKNAGSDCVTGGVLHDCGDGKSQVLGAASTESHLETNPRALNPSGPSLQSRASGPADGSRVSPVTVREKLDEFSENPCENSNLAASLLLGLAPKGPSSSGTRSKAEKKRSLSILQRSTDRFTDVVHMKMEQTLPPSKISGPNSSSLTSELDLGSSASIKSKVGLPSPVSREIGLWGVPPPGEVGNSSPEPRSSLDFFESVTLQLKETKILKEKPISVKDELSQKHKEEGKMPEIGKLSRRRKLKCSKYAPLDDVPAKATTKPKPSLECHQTRERTPRPTSESGRHRGENNRTPVDSGSGQQLAQDLQKSGLPVDENKELKCPQPFRQGCSDQEEERSKGGESSKTESADGSISMSLWGDTILRRKRVQRSRNPTRVQGLQIVSPVVKGGR